MKKRLFMPMNLQFFSESGDDRSGDGGQRRDLPVGSQETPTGVKEENNTDKTFSRSKVAKTIATETNKAEAAWGKELAARKEEAKKLVEMDAGEKLQREPEQREAEIAELKRNQTLNEMKSEVFRMLSSASLPQDDELPGLITPENAEAIKRAILITTKFASQIEKENACQSTPGEDGQFTADKETE